MKKNTLITSLLCFHFSAFAAPQAMNVLFITIDDLNTDLGAYGHPLVQSPNIDKLAETGVLFSKAYSQVPKCTPSRSSFMTGLYPDQTGVIAHGSHTRLDAHFRDHIPGVTTLPEMFKQQGYVTARVGKVYHQGVPNQIGSAGADDAQSWNITVNPKGVDVAPKHVAKIKAFNPRALAKKSFGGVLSFLSIESKDADHTDGKVALETIELMKQLHPEKTGKPFFLAAGFYRPHTPYVAPKKYFDLYPLESISPYEMPKNDRSDIPKISLADRPFQRELNLNQRKQIIQGYYATISFIDAQVGLLLDALKANGLADNTIVVLLSDHGYELGQHDLWQKGSLFEGSAKVPLIIYAPHNSENGFSIDYPTELIDIYPTLASLTNLTPPKYLSGTDLSPTFKNPSVIAKDSAYTSILNRFRGKDSEFAYKKIRGKSIRTQRYRYTEWGNGLYGAELYDHLNDPEELNNLADKVAFEDIRIKMKWALDDAVIKAETRIKQIEK